MGLDFASPAPLLLLSIHESLQLQQPHGALPQLYLLESKTQARWAGGQFYGFTLDLSCLGPYIIQTRKAAGGVRTADSNRKPARERAAGDEEDYEVVRLSPKAHLFGYPNTKWDVKH